MNAKSVGRKLPGNPLAVATQTSLPLSSSQTAANHSPQLDELQGGREIPYRSQMSWAFLLVQSEVDVRLPQGSPLGFYREKVLDLVCGTP